MVFSYEVEQQLIAGLISFPLSYPEVAGFINEDDFYSKSSLVNKTVFKVLRTAIEKGETLTDVLISERVKSLGISFEDNIDISDYITGLSLRMLDKSSVLNSAKELKKLSVRRDISENGMRVSEAMKSLDPSYSFNEIINTADEIYNEKLNFYDNGDNFPSDVFAEMRDAVEERGNNPLEEFGPSGPHKRLQELYGSLLRPGNITTIVARTGVGKTQFCMDFCTKSSKMHGIPILHLDNGEMSKEELLMRQCASLSGVPLNLLETGKWHRAGSDIIKKVRNVWDMVSDYQFYYYNVGGLSVDNMINIVKRFYYAKVKRGNPLILSFDYIKTTSENMKNKSEWQVVGEMVDKFKKLIQKDIVVDGIPTIAMMTSVQSNRSGITNNRTADTIVDDESIVSLSDRITQFSSHLFSLRQKTLDELAEEEGFGTHKLLCFKYRHLGEDVHRALQPVRLPEGDLKKNYINLDFNNFNVKEKGDLKDFVDRRLEVTLGSPQPDAFDSLSL